MCLYTKQICPKKAIHDIECYKVVDYDLNTGDILSPIIGAHLVFNQVLNAQFETSNLHHTFLPSVLKFPKYDVLKQKVIAYRSIGSINDGFFHSYRNFSNAAVTKINSLPSFRNIRRKIVRCIIPKGALYYTSEDAIEYASTHLILKEYV